MPARYTRDGARASRFRMLPRHDIQRKMRQRQPAIDDAAAFV